MQKSVESTIRGELIGLPVRVSAASDPGRVGMAGLVVDETRETFRIRTETGLRVVPKRGTGFTFETGGRLVTVPGDAMAFRPEDRTKKAKVRS